MGKQSGSSLTWLYTTAAAALVLWFVTYSLLPFMVRQPQQQPDTLSMPRQSAGSHAPERSISGVTGRLWEGGVVRVYQGQGRSKTTTTPTLMPRGIVKVSRRSPKWAVCTTVNLPSKQVLDTVQLQGWSVVIAEDKGGKPFNLSAPNLVVLSPSEQEQWAAAFEGFQQLPWRHFGRKNLAYLYAVVHGAQMIWDFDDDNGLNPGVVPAVPSSDVFRVQVPSDCEAFNPYPIMGSPAATPPAWPRGLPLPLIRSPCQHTLVPTNNTRTVAVVQSLANNDPDVDAIFRLTRGVPFNFDASSRSSLIIPHGTLTPWNAQATLFQQPALWGLLLPVTVHGRVSDIWQSYIAQRLMWDVGLHVAFSPPMVTQIRSAHNYLADMSAEYDLYHKSLELVRFLRQWQGSAATLPGRYEELLIALYERQYVELQDVQLAQHWLAALTSIGYRFPDVLPAAASQPHQRSSPVAFRSASMPPAPEAALDAFTEGACCPGAVVDSVSPRESVCRFRRSRSLLVNKPDERPAKFGHTCLARALDIKPSTPPVYSVLLNVWNSGHKLRVGLTQLLKHTHGPWELIVAFDGCKDDSYRVAVGVLDRMASWPTCRHTVAEIDPTARWASGVNLTGSQGDIGLECWHQPSSLVSVRLINTTGAGLFATASDNLKMLSSRGQVYILVDDDQFMTVSGWNVNAAYPLTKWPDVFSVSMRCAHDFPLPKEARAPIPNLQGAKCRDSTARQASASPQHRCRFYEADSGNRGPLLLRATYVQQLGYMDELHHAGVITLHCDHDLNYRAYHQKGWVSGFIPVDFTEDRTRKPLAHLNATQTALEKEYVQWFHARRARSPNATSRWTRPAGTHTKQRVIQDVSWHLDCAV